VVVKAIGYNHDHDHDDGDNFDDENRKDQGGTSTNGTTPAIVDADDYDDDDDNEIGYNAAAAGLAAAIFRDKPSAATGCEIPHGSADMPRRATTCAMPPRSAELSVQQPPRRATTGNIGAHSAHKPLMECRICAQEFQEGVDIYESNNPKCRHIFHKACMDKVRPPKIKGFIHSSS